MTGNGERKWENRLAGLGACCLQTGKTDLLQINTPGKTAGASMQDALICNFVSLKSFSGLLLTVSSIDLRCYSWKMDENEWLCFVYINANILTSTPFHLEGVSVQVGTFLRKMWPHPFLDECKTGFI